MPSKTAASKPDDAEEVLTPAVIAGASEGEGSPQALQTTEESRKLTEDIIMGRGALEGVDDPANAQEQIVRRILAAPDEDAVLAEDSTVATQELVGVPLEVKTFRLLKSQLADPVTGEVKEGAFMIVEALRLAGDAENEEGEFITLNTGAPKIMAQLIRLQQLERLPARVKVAEVGQAKLGRNRALQLVSA